MKFWFLVSEILHLGRVLMSSIIQTRSVELAVKRELFQLKPLVSCVCIRGNDYCVCVKKKKKWDVSILPLDQIQALVWMNSMLVLPEQSAVVHRFTCSVCLPHFLRQHTGKVPADFYYFFKQPPVLLWPRLLLTSFINCCCFVLFFFCFPS